MNFIFWQGIVSIHQKTFLEALARHPRVRKVILVADEWITAYRKNMGWEVPDFEGVEVIVAPAADKVRQLVADNKGAIHIMGGVRVGKSSTLAFDEAIKQKAKMGVMAEPYDRTGIKGKIRDVKYRIEQLRYYRHIDFFLAIGKAGVDTYTRLGFDKKRVFPWAYFVTVNVPERQPAPDEDIRIIYAGRIDENKGIYRFVKELAASGRKNYRLDIYGEGVEEAALKQFVADNNLTDKVTISPFLKYDVMIQQYARYDWVVLPSTRKDGWGVIINEGLQNGLKAICSNICGVSQAISNDFNGVTFDWAEKDGCRKAIAAMLDNKTFGSNVAIRDWAEISLTGTAGANFLLQILDCTYSGKDKPAPPWTIIKK